jgi:protein-disulfide isomerase
MKTMLATVAVWLVVTGGPFAQTGPTVRIGAADAPVVLTFFADLGSEPAAHAAIVLRTLLERYPERLAVEVRLRPADGQMHPAEAAVVAAAQQERGWQMVELLLANQDRRHGRDFSAMARQLQLDEDRFAAAMADEPAARARVDDDLAEAAALKLPKGMAVVADGKPVTPTVSEVEAQFASLLGTPRDAK